MDALRVGCVSGSTTAKVAPCPGALSTRTVPESAVTISRDRFRSVDGERGAYESGLVAEGRADLPHDLGQVDALEVQLHAPARDAGDVQHAIDQTGEPLRLTQQGHHAASILAARVATLRARHLLHDQG